MGKNFPTPLATVKVITCIKFCKIKLKLEIRDIQYNSPVCFYSSKVLFKFFLLCFVF